MVVLACGVLCGLGAGGASAAGWKIESLPPVPLNDPFLVKVACSTADRCVALGLGYDRTNQQVTFAAHRMGGSWSVDVVPGLPGNRVSTVLQDIACAAVNSCFAVGGSQ